MTSLATTRSRRRWTAAIVAANLAGLTAVALALAGPGRADAARQYPAPQAFIPLTEPASSATSATGQVTSPSGGYLYRSGRYTPLNSLDGLLTADAAVNDRGETAGSYATAAGQIRGFVRDAKGNFTAFDGAASATTDAIGINDEGAVAGVYGVIGAAANGFMRSPDGKITTIDVPGASSTYLFDINDSGAVVGFYTDAQGLKNGFLYQHGTVTTIDPPGLPAAAAARDTAATDISNRGQIVGYYADAKGTYHGYLYDHGRFTILDPPHAANVATFATTAPFGINDSGQVVGQYIDSSSVLHGYLWQPGRGFTTVNAPQIVSFNRGITGAGTIASDITDQGRILLPAAGDLFAARTVPISG